MTIGDPQLIYSNHIYEKQLEKLKRANEKAVPAKRPGEIKNEKLYNACVEFESLFIKQMLDVMRKSVEKSDFLHGGMAEDIFEDMLYDEYSLLMAKNAGFGLADTVYRQLTPQESGIIAPQPAQK
jgi:Rod binding domain-containing protein